MLIARCYLTQRDHTNTRICVNTMTSLLHALTHLEATRSQTVNQEV